MKFVIFTTLLSLICFLQPAEAGDGVGNFIIKAMKTTTPLLRPQRNGFYLNVHEQEDIQAEETEAIEQGLESQISRIWDNVHRWENDVQGEHIQLKRDVSVSRAIDTANSNARDFKEDHPPIDQQGIIDNLFTEYVHSEIKQEEDSSKQKGQAQVRPGMRPDFSPQEKPLRAENPEIECIRSGTQIIERLLKKKPCDKTLTDWHPGKNPEDKVTVPDVPASEAKTLPDGVAAEKVKRSDNQELDCDRTSESVRETLEAQQTAKSRLLRGAKTLPQR